MSQKTDGRQQAALGKVSEWKSLSVVAISAVVVLFLIAIAGATGSRAVQAADLQVMGMLRSVESPLLTALFRTVSYSASFYSIGGVLLLLVLRWHRHGRRSDAILLAVTVAGGAVLGSVIKFLFSRPRPESVAWLTTAIGWSYPSGHTLSAATLAGSLAWVSTRRQSGRRAGAVWGPAGLWVAAVGVSRIYLGVHYLSDVLASLAVGGVWLLLVAMVERVRRPNGA